MLTHGEAKHQDGTDAPLHNWSSLFKASHSVLVSSSTFFSLLTIHSTQFGFPLRWLFRRSGKPRCSWRTSTSGRAAADECAVAGGSPCQLWWTSKHCDARTHDGTQWQHGKAVKYRHNCSCGLSKLRFELFIFSTHPTFLVISYHVSLWLRRTSQHDVKRQEMLCLSD